MNQIIDFLIVVFLCLLFASIYRKRQTQRVLFWLTGWCFVLLHFFAFLFHPVSTTGQTIQCAASLSALIFCGVCFVLSLDIFRGKTAHSVTVLCLIGLPWSVSVMLASSPRPWIAALAVSACAGQLGALTLAVAFYRKSWKLLLAQIALIAACSAWLVAALLHGDVNAAVEAVLTQCFGLNALLFSFEQRRLSAGTGIVSLGLYAWSAVWAIGMMLDRMAPNLAVNVEIWNLPKYFVAAGMILVLLEEEILSAKIASEQYRLLFAGNPHPMWMYDRDTLGFLQVNDAAVAHYGYTREEFQTMTLLDVQPDGCREAPAELRTNEPKQLSGPWEHQRKDGSIVQADIASHPLIHEGREVTFALMQDVTDRQRLHEKLVMQAHHDILTGLPNRALFEERTKDTLAHASQHSHKSALLCMDVDRFKQINDTYGHAAGDLCLKEIALRLGTKLGVDDTLARTGGEEFAVLLHSIAQGAEAERVAEDILQALKPPVQIDGFEIELAVSIGIAIYPEDGEHAARLWRDADTAMYRAKHRGGAQYVRVSKAISISATEASDVEVSLRRALKAGDFEIYYQPQMTMDGHLYGLEALVRSTDSLLRKMSPGRFIPVAEESGLIVPLGNWVLEEVCRQSREWMSIGLPPVRVAVNVSPLQLTRFDFSKKVMDTLTRHKLSPDLLEFEVTESTLMPETGHAFDQIDVLANMGIRFSVDDFGTGYSSLGRLHQLPVDQLKIDQSFIERIAEPRGTYPIVEAIISLAHSLGMKVIAEGVEKEEQLTQLRKLGCDRIQGYYFQRPLSALHTTQYLQSVEKMADAVA
jgi:diguanylate cyclase (GGDEF)-like protein/PAS domain S-box-containing protein